MLSVAFRYLRRCATRNDSCVTVDYNLDRSVGGLLLSGSSPVHALASWEEEMERGSLQVYSLGKGGSKNVKYEWMNQFQPLTLTEVRQNAKDMESDHAFLFEVWQPDEPLAKRYYFFGATISLQETRQHFHNQVKGVYCWQLLDDLNRLSNEIILKQVLSLQIPGS